MLGLVLGVNAEAEKDEGVLVLTDSNFDEELAKYDYLLVEFYAPWCGHCKSLAPEYAKAAATLAKNDPPLYLAKVDATEQKKLGERFEIQGFPTLAFFDHGNKMEYNGGRTADDIVNWILKKTGPPSQEKSCDDVKTAAKDMKLGLIYFGAAEGDLFSAHESTGRSDVGDKFSLLHTTADCASEFGASAPGIALVRNFDNSPVVFSGESTADSLKAFAKENSVPVLIEFSEDYIEPIFGDQQSAVILFSEGRDAAFNKVFSEAATALKGDILFVNSGASDGIQARLAEFIGVSASDLPTMRIIAPKQDMRKFTYSGDLNTLSVESLKTFLADFNDGKLEPFLKSEPIPESQDGPVTVLVGKNFEQIVMDPSKDVLVKFYAPWCGHCKSLAPIFEDLGKNTADIEDLVIAKFDATVNEVDGVEIQGYPTLKFYPKDNKNGVNYEGGRELKDFEKYFAENSSAYKQAKPQKNEEAPKSEEL